MGRILVSPDELRGLGALLERSATEVQLLSGRTGSALGTLGWQVSSQVQIEEHHRQARRMADDLAARVREMAAFLRRKADAFDEADRADGARLLQGLPDWVLEFGRGYRLPVALMPWLAVAPATGVPVMAATTAAWVTSTFPGLFGEQPAPVSTPGPGHTTGSAAPGPGVQTEVPTPAEPAPNHVDAMLAKYFPRPEDRLILKHTMSEEGPGRFGAAWGGVVYQKEKSEPWIADGQMLNFGLISFAFPSGSAGGVLRKILSSPEEEQAFREIALRHLQDNPGGEIKEGWRHFLRTTADPTYAPKSNTELVDEFLVQIKSGNDRQAADWLFKYANVEITGAHGVNTTRLRGDWNALFEEWLARPASQVAQLSTARETYFDGVDGADGAVDLAGKLGLKTVRGVAFAFDAKVQGGSLPAKAWTTVETTAYKHAPESQKLEMLRDIYGQGSTEWHRRNSVLQSTTLTDDPYPFPGKQGGSQA